MIVLVLLVIWIVALAPFVLRRLSEHQLTVSVSQFRRLTGMFGRAHAATTGEAPYVQRRASMSVEEERRLLKQRARARSERRRRVFTWLLGFGAGTLLLGAVPALRLLWDLTIVDAVLTGTYVGALAYFTRLEIADREYEAVRNVYPIAPGSAEALPTRAYATGGGGATRSMPAPIPIRPAFRIVEAPS